MAVQQSEITSGATAAGSAVAAPTVLKQAHRGSIAYVSPRYAPFIGGVETHVTHLASRAAAQGYRVEVLTQESDRTLPPIEAIDGVTVRRFRSVGWGPNFTVALGLWLYLARRRADYDLVHAHSYHALPALGAALAGDRPLVFTPHYHGVGHSALRSLLHVPYRRLGAAIFDHSCRVICVSDVEAALVCRDFPAVAERITVIPNGVEVAELQAAAPYAHDHTVVLSVGRLEEYKNVHLTIEALAYMHDRYVLYVIGDGPARPALEALAARLELRHRVTFLGRVDQGALRRWFRTAAVYVSMSRHEAFGITLLEGVAAGAAVVASDIPAYREVAGLAGRDSIRLTLLDADPSRVAQAIDDAATRAVHSPPVATLPSWDDVATRTMQIYDTILRCDLERLRPAHPSADTSIGGLSDHLPACHSLVNRVQGLAHASHTHRDRRPS